MTDTPVLRTGRDRLRYTIAFEALLVAMLIPAGAVYFDKPLASVGVLGAILSLKAMAIGLLYNWVFDRIEVVAYTYVFTLAYDRMFPLARPARARGQAAALRSHPAR